VRAWPLAVLRDRLAALGARLARGKAQLHDLLAAEERQAGERVRELAPVEAPGGLEHLAVGETACARRRAHRVRRLERDQRLVAVDDVDGAEAAPEVRLELLRAKLHGQALGFCAEDSRRMICCTMSPCMSR